LQAGSFVYGLEADLSWLNNKSTYVDPNGAINNFFPSETNRLNDLGTVRGRLGLAVDRSLFYFTAGLAFGEVANRWGNRPASLWIAEDFGCCASG
jgi:outer membrane immunogenic protein